MRYFLIMVLLFAPTTYAHSPDEFLDLIDVTKESVVFVVNTPYVDSEMTGLGSPFSKMNPQMPKDNVPPRNPGKRGEPDKPMGTGFIVEGGYIITNWHVIENAKEIEVYFEDSRKPYAVELIAFDKKVDIAILKPGSDFPKVVPLHWREKEVRQGEEVFAVGHPLGYRWSVTKGIISHLDRRPASRWQPTIQTDTAINQGNSGGPLLDMDGKVVAINVMIIAPNGGFMGIALSIDHTVAQRAIVTLLEHGEIKRPLMGALLEFNDEEYLVEAVGITSGSAADLAGMKKGDLYVEMDGHPIKDADDIFDVLSYKVPGDNVTVKVLRDGKLITIIVKLKGLPAS